MAQSNPQVERTTQFDKQRARERGAIAGIVAVAATWVPIYIAYLYLSRPLGDELATGITAVVGLFAVSLLFVVQDQYANWEAKHYCSKNGHVLRNQIAADGRPFVYCERCSTVMIGKKGGTDG